VLWPVALAPYFLGLASAIYGVTALVLSALFTLCALRVLRDPTDRAAKQMFGFSLLYLFLLFAVLVADRPLSLVLALGS
jgi:protoheme IX farnesyltransferase